MAEKITTHLHLSCHLLTVELFSCFMMAAILDKSALTGNRMNFVKNCFSIFKTSPATCADYLQANDLHELHQGRSTDYLFSLKLWSLLCEHVQTKGGRGVGVPEKDTFMQHDNWMTPKGLHENHFSLWMFHHWFFIKTLSNQLLINYLQNCLNFLFKIVWKSLSTFLMSISPF